MAAPKDPKNAISWTSGYKTQCRILDRLIEGNEKEIAEEEKEEARLAKLAARNGIFVEISSRAGHSLTNGVVANVGREAGVKFLINSDAHSHNDLFKSDMQERVGLGSGLKKDEVEEIFNKNYKEFLKRIGC